MRFIIKNEGSLDDPKFGIYTDSDWDKFWDLDLVSDNIDLEQIIMDHLSHSDLCKIYFESEASKFYAHTDQQKIAQSMTVKFKKAAIKGITKRLVEYLTN